MDPQPNENFFELKVSQEGSARLLRLFRIVRWMFLISICCSFIFIGHSILRVFFFRYGMGADGLLRAEIIATPIYIFVVTILFLFQTYSYFYFTRLCKRAIELQQADLFNHSFKWLIKSALISLVAWIIQVIMGGFSLYVGIHALQKYPAP
jgi:hypothetical protein